MCLIHLENREVSVIEYEAGGQGDGKEGREVGSEQGRVVSLEARTRHLDFILLRWEISRDFKQQSALLSKCV